MNDKVNKPDLKTTIIKRYPSKTVVDSTMVKDPQIPKKHAFTHGILIVYISLVGMLLAVFFTGFQQIDFYLEPYVLKTLIVAVISSQTILALTKIFNYAFSPLKELKKLKRLKK
ncbi:MAG: hypothetical protein D9C04_05685 [Nitrosopumilus sp. B06]|nr:MAG: hypothetical protein EB828_06050 [Nitrosopumilus sp. D6]RNJ79199.1 MAG: hypothetical protein D9C04_05685 [Nitrosopumilus sp. B06]